jgi:Flp pilus assembly pilin Flp
MPTARLNAFLKDERGITVVEYAIGAGLITASITLALTSLGLTIGRILQALSTFLAG